MVKSSILNKVMSDFNDTVSGIESVQKYTRAQYMKNLMPAKDDDDDGEVAVIEEGTSSTSLECIPPSLVLKPSRKRKRDDTSTSVQRQLKSRGVEGEISQTLAEPVQDLDELYSDFVKFIGDDTEISMTK